MEDVELVSRWFLTSTKEYRETINPDSEDLRELEGKRINGVLHAWPILQESSDVRPLVSVPVKRDPGGLGNLYNNKEGLEIGSSTFLSERQVSWGGKVSDDIRVSWDWESERKRGIVE